jgi:hypothetical protein
MANVTVAYRPAPWHEIKHRARQFAYLNDPDKIMVALANEYGADRRMPSRAWIESVVAERNKPLRRSARG